MTAQTKRTLLFEYISMDSPDLVSRKSALSMEKISTLKEINVKTIFIITSRAIYKEPYLRLIKAYEESNFRVKSIHIEELDNEHLKIINNAVNEIAASLNRGSCEVVSFGKSYAGTIISCYFVAIGNSAPDAIEKVRQINKNLPAGNAEISYVYRYQKFLRPSDKAGFEQLGPEMQDEIREEIKPAEDGGRTAKPPLLEKTRIKSDVKQESRQDEAIIKDALKVKPSDRPAEKIAKQEKPPIIEKAPAERKVKDEKPPVTEKAPEKKEFQPAAQPLDIKALEGLRFGKFYQSIRFKLISIISFLIIVSISLMIFIATYFFKGDNEIRVNENNLKLSELSALKVKSDFQTIIDKSKLLANAIMQNTGRQEIDRYSELILQNDRDFIFFGLAVPSKKEGSLEITNPLYNNPLMLESQITKEDIQSVNTANANVFNRSFKGETVIHNVSPGFKQPVIGISLPFHKSAAGDVKSMLVSYIKLDKFLKAFTASGITKMFMVNEQGDIIAHPDSAIVVSGGNYINLPIVKLMIKSALDNGLTRYKDENGIYHLGSFKKIGIGGVGIIATVEENMAFQAIYDMQRRNIYLMVIVLTSVILIIYFFAKTLTTPIINLVSATKLIKEGNFNIPIAPTTRDEIGELTGAFIEMGHGLEEREKMKDAFGKFVNKEIAEQVLKGTIRLGGERKNAAVFFSDIRSFTSISEKLEPEEVVEFLNAYMTKMVNCVYATKGVVDKYIGDAIMAEWGVPISYGNDTENAVNAALMMRKELLEFNKGRGDVKKPIIKIGCGINSGPVLAGQIGSEDRMEYTVIGDTVNLASRIEALNKPFGTDILISEDAYNVVKDKFAVEKMSPIKVKGKEKPQQIFAVLGRLDDPERPKNTEELRKYVGIEALPLKRRWNDKEGEDESIKEEVKYEILE